LGAHSRRKGAQFEREVVTLAKEHGFSRAVREAPMQAGHGGRFMDVAGVGRLRIECKRRASGSLAAGREHVEGEEVPGFVNVAACRDDHGEALAVLRLVDLLKLERAALEAPSSPVAPRSSCGEGRGCLCAPGGSWDGAVLADEAERERLRTAKDLSAGGA
jgi:Holliday junction resolvase